MTLDEEYITSREKIIHSNRDIIKAKEGHKHEKPHLCVNVYIIVDVDKLW